MWNRLRVPKMGAALRYAEMVVVKDIPVFAHCRCHALPIVGRCHVGYVPGRLAIGLEMLARLVDLLSRRPQVPEHLTLQIAETLQAFLNPAGVGVMLEARPHCIVRPGAQKKCAIMITSAMCGTFRSERHTRAEFLRLIYRPRIP